MTRGLIGYTGFVGSNLCEQAAFDALYNSKNFRDMSGEHFSELVCAGVSAVKWKANKAPEEDLARIRELMDVLRTVRADCFILISTIDVYPILEGKDESFNCHSQSSHPYAENRLLFEDFCAEHFSCTHTIRLPGLFGKGLKKNVIYDLLNEHMMETINPDSVFQYYCLNGLWEDIRTVVNANVPLVNLFTEPVATSEILHRFFPGLHVGQRAAPSFRYNLLTKYGELFGQTEAYRHDKERVLQQMGDFIATYSMGSV